MRERTHGQAPTPTGVGRRGSKHGGYWWIATLALLGLGSIAGPQVTVAEWADSRAGGHHGIRTAETAGGQCRICHADRRAPANERMGSVSGRAFDRADASDERLDCVAAIRMSAAIGISSLRAAHQPLSCNLVTRLLRPQGERAEAPATATKSSPSPLDARVAMAGRSRPLQRP